MNIPTRTPPLTQMRHSRFDADRFNVMARFYTETYGRAFPEVADYAEFARAYPTTTRDDLRAISEGLVAGGGLQNCYVVSTSGTTSEPLILVNRIWREADEDSYPKQFFDHLFEHVFTSGDVVANLCFPGGLGLLYEGMCTVMEPMGLTILPLGRLDSFKNDRTHFELFRKLGLNTLVGSPASITEFARTATALGVRLDIAKLVFSAESFHTSKRDAIRRSWPEAAFYSLYGSTEFGLAAVGTPDLPSDHHRLLDDWFMIECDADGTLYVTDLKTPMVPVIRYRIGDSGTLTTGSDGSTRLIIRGRCDSAFNFAGALLGFEELRNRVRAAATDDPACDADLQLVLATDAEGRDVLTVVLEHDLAAPSARAIRDAIRAHPSIAEDLVRGVVDLDVRGREHLRTTRRGKRPNIVDLRHT